jgi:hypothetical protein
LLPAHADNISRTRQATGKVATEKKRQNIRQILHDSRLKSRILSQRHAR